MYFFVGKPNFVQLVGFSNSPHQIVTDYYSLGNLAQALLGFQSIFLTKRIAISITLQIGRAVRLMHDSGFAHADIKALNIFVDKDAKGNLNCYLGDFGLSQVLDDTHLIVKAYQVYNMKGLTVPYAAPELIQRFRKRKLNSEMTSWKAGDFLRADVYAFSILMQEIFNCAYAWGWNKAKN
jgi:serine/threonine protein kinase